MRRYSYNSRKAVIWKYLKNMASALSGALLMLFNTTRRYRNGRIKEIAKIGNFTEKIKNIKGKEIPIPLTRKFMDFLSFKKIFVIWIVFVFSFGFVYSSLTLSSAEDGLIGVDTTSYANLLLNSVYFSFVAATSTGFGDITPLGMSKMISIIEIIGSMVIFAVVVSKLVSFKQEVILDEIYEISLDEKVNRLRSGLYLSRSDITRINDKITEGRPPKIMIERLWSVMNTMQETLIDIQKLICPTQSKKADFVKKVGNFQVELLLNSIALSFNRLNELLSHLDAIRYNWRTAKNIEGVKSVLFVVDAIQGYYHISENPYGIKKRLEEIKTAKKSVEKHM